MSYLVLDTEGTDKYPETAEVLSISIIDNTGAVLLDTLVRPVRHTEWPAAQRIHGITPAQVLRPELPTLEELNPIIADILRGRVVVIYTAVYDTWMLSEAFALGPPAEVHCAMLAFSGHPKVRFWNDYYCNWYWQSLHDAAERVGHQWRGPAHTALADCFATRDVWAWLTDPVEHERVEAAREERDLQQRVDWYLSVVWQAEASEADKAIRARNEAWELAHYPSMGVREFRRPVELQAEDSANVFCQHLTGYPVGVWNEYGRKLKLKRYGQPGMPKRPAHLVTAEKVHFLRRHWNGDTVYCFDSDKTPAPIQPVAMLQTRADFPKDTYCRALKPLFSLNKLVLGVDYVPYVEDYQPGYCSRTALVRDHKLKQKQADQVRPAFMLLRKKYDDYLLYPIPVHEPALTS